MLDAKQLWDKSKLLFLIAIPVLIVVFVFRDLIFAALAGSARRTAEKAKMTDATIKEKANKADVEAALAKAAADAAAKRLADRTADDVPEDWHEKGKKR